MGKEKNDSYGFFLVAIGLLTGFFLGGVVVFWYSNRNEIKILSDRMTDRIPAMAQPEPGIKKETVPEKPLESGGDNVRGDQKPGIDADKKDPGEDMENLRISRNRLIAIRGFYPRSNILPTPDAESSAMLDSLMGSKRTAPSRDQVFYLEFWESPLSYAIYKRGLTRGIIFGIDRVDQVGLFELDDLLYMKYGEQYYTLEFTTEFRTLIPESDPEIITKLELLWP